MPNPDVIRHFLYYSVEWSKFSKGKREWGECTRVQADPELSIKQKLWGNGPYHDGNCKTWNEDINLTVMLCKQLVPQEHPSSCANSLFLRSTPLLKKSDMMQRAWYIVIFEIYKLHNVRAAGMLFERYGKSTNGKLKSFLWESN